MNIKTLFLSSVIGLTSIFGGVSDVEASQTCSIQQRRTHQSFACEVVDTRDYLSIKNLSNYNVETFEYTSNNRYQDNQGNVWIREGKSIYLNGTAIHFF